MGSLRERVTALEAEVPKESLFELINQPVAWWIEFEEWWLRELKDGEHPDLDVRAAIAESEGIIAYYKTLPPDQIYTGR